ncbi:Fc.00g069200.m01.CDS01 [Cosmosporella sp. VM-42]
MVTFRWPDLPQESQLKIFEAMAQDPEAENKDKECALKNNPKVSVTNVGYANYSLVCKE